MTPKPQFKTLKAIIQGEFTIQMCIKFNTDYKMANRVNKTLNITPFMIKLSSKEM